MAVTDTTAEARRREALQAAEAKRRAEAAQAAAAAQDARDESFARNREVWALTAHVSIVGLFALALLGTLFLARDIIVPIMLAWVVANILLPVVSWMEQNRVPRILAVIIATLTLIFLLLAILGLLSLPMTYWLGRATELGEMVRQKMQSMSEPLTFLKEIMGAIGSATGQATDQGVRIQEDNNIVGNIFAILTPAVSQTILFLGALIFYLIYQKKIKARSVLVLPGREQRLTALRILNDIERNTTVYFGTFTIVNICLGIVTTALAWFVGLPNPLLWGVLAAIVNYIPYIGVAIMLAVLFLVGLFTFPTLPEALVAPLVYMGITTIEGHFLTPALMGRKMTLNPFAVFLAIGFWTWMWGPIGAFVAVPILMATTVTFRHLFPKELPTLPDET
jgi:predicted PurR-regulated permease PerM